MLNVEDIQAHYGASQALFGTRLAVNTGEVVTLMGRNGMGKTTSVHCIMGIVPTSAGRVLWEDQVITNLPSFRIAQAGIGLVPEGRQVFPNLTVIENLVAAARSGGHPDKSWNVERVFDMFPALAARRDGLGNLLSGGEQQMVAIGRAVMAKPRLLLLDEPSGGLAPQFINEIGTIIQALKDDGATMLMVEQNLALAFKVADRFIILRDGAVSDGGFVKAMEGSQDAVSYTHLRAHEPLR